MSDEISGGGTSDSERLTIVVDGQEYQIPSTVETERDILRAIQYDPNVYALYRDADKETLTDDDRAGAWEDDPYNAPSVVVSDGDGFVVIPKEVTDG